MAPQSGVRIGWISLAAILFATASLAPGRAATVSGVVGCWQLLRESDGTVPLAGAQIILCLHEDGRAAIMAAMPGASPVFDNGRYSPAAGRFSITFAALGISASAQPYQLTGTELILPFRPIGAVRGTSTWRRRTEQASPVTTAFAAWRRTIERGGTAPQAAAAAAQETKRRHPGKVIDVVPTSDGGAVVIEYVGSKEIVIFRTRPAGIESGQVRPRRKSPLLFDPRTHRRIAGNPIDNPAHASVALLLPFQNTPYLSYPIGGVWEKIKLYWRGGKPWWTESFNEDVQRYRAVFTKTAGIAPNNLRVYVDAHVTPKVIYEELAQRQVGLFYLSTHSQNHEQGRWTALATGAFLGALLPEDAGRAQQILAASQYAKELPPSLVVLDTDWTKATLVPAWVGQMQGIGGEDVIAGLFVGVTDAFFRALRADLSKSLVFINGCTSARVPHLAAAMGAKAFIGFREEISTVSSNRIATHIFETLARETRSTREAVDRVKDVTETNAATYPEDEVLLDANGVDQEGLQSTYFSMRLAGEMLVGYGSDFREYPRISPVVGWLLWIARWAQNAATGVAKLEDACNQFWCVGKKPTIKDIFANAGILGTHVPTREEVNDAEQLLDGTPRPVPHGRFTLNDGRK